MGKDTNAKQHYPQERGAKKYGVILADPPWQYSNRGVNGASEKHYTTMTPRQIQSLPVAHYADENCVLVLWSTNPMLPVALDVMKEWGFVFVTAFPWIKFTGKPQFDAHGNVVEGRVSWGTGFWARGCSELILIGRKGHARPPEQDFLGILSDRLQHSKKPETVYDYCEAMHGPYLELFARGYRDGWDVWGNEVENDIHLTEWRPDDLDDLKIQKGLEIKRVWEQKQQANWVIGDAIVELVRAGMGMMKAYQFAASHMVGVNSIYWPRYFYKVALTFPVPERKKFSRSWHEYRTEYDTKIRPLLNQRNLEQRERKHALRDTLVRRMERPGE